MLVQMKNPTDGFSTEFNTVAKILGRYDRTLEEAVMITQIVPPTRYPKILDICCGFGRMSGALHAHHYQVTAMDLSADQIRAAEKNNPGPTYLKADMRAPPLNDFDAAINMFTSFGYFEEESQDIEALGQWYKALRPGGVLIMELADMDLARHKLPSEDSIFTRKTGDLIERCSMDWEKQIFQVTYMLSEIEFTCCTRIYEKDALKRHLLSVGFRNVDLYGNLNRNEKVAGDNLIIVAEK